MTDAYTTLRARIHLQVREGVLNTLSEFEIRAKDTHQNEDGTLDHLVPSDDIIRGLAIALRTLVEHMREMGADDRDEQWFTQISDYIFKVEATK